MTDLVQICICNIQTIIFTAQTLSDPMLGNMCLLVKTALVVLENNKCNFLDIYKENEASHAKIAWAGEMFLLKLYNAKKTCVSLDNLRLSSYMQMMKKTKKRKSSSIAPFKLESLQPTTAKYHAYRDYFAVQEWLGNSLQATDWSWDYNVICSVQPTQSDQPHPILD